jgi:NitT/TauT family transport system substrate-binding protein
MAGKIDATTISYGSWLVLPNKAGLHLLVTKDDYRRAMPIIAKVNIVRAQAPQDKRQDIIKVTAALIRLARDFEQQPLRWAEEMRTKRPDVPAAALEALARAYASDWCVDGCFNRSELESTAKLFYNSPGFPAGATPPLRAWADSSILSQAMHRLEGEEASKR